MDDQPIIEIGSNNNSLDDQKGLISAISSPSEISLNDEDKTEVVKSVEKESGTLNKINDKWNDEYNVVKKKPKTTNEYYYINTREFYTEENSKGEKNTKLINWNLIKGEAKYYIKEFKKQTFYDQ